MITERIEHNEALKKAICDEIGMEIYNLYVGYRSKQFEAIYCEEKMKELFFDSCKKNGVKHYEVIRVKMRPFMIKCKIENDLVFSITTKDKEIISTIHLDFRENNEEEAEE